MADDTKVIPAVEEEPKVEEIEEPKVEEEPEIEDPDDDTQEAVRLYKALKDPKSAERVIRILAEDIGILDTKQKKTEAKNIILESFEESLGDEYKFLAPKLSGALDKILNEHTRKIDEKFSELKQAEITTASNAAVTEMMKDPEFEKHHKRIMQLMDEVQHSGNVSPATHLKRLFILAKEEAKGTTQKSSTSNKLKQALEDIPGKLRNSSSGGDDSNFKSDRPLTRREAIEQAHDELLSAK